MKRILCIVTLLLSLNSMAQITLGMGRFGFLAPNDTVAGGSSDTYDVWVKNYGPGTFNDVLIVNTALRDSAGIGLDSVNYYISAGNVIINAGDSTSVTLTNNYTLEPAGPFRYGIDVIVIWPYSASAITVDSLEYTVYIEGHIGVNELDAEQLIRAYPNPASDKITLETASGMSIESITIYDLMGKIVTSNSRQHSINIEGLVPGIYFTEVILSNKKRYSIRIVKGKNSTE
jgi:hypothetical protein